MIITTAALLLPDPAPGITDASIARNGAKPRAQTPFGHRSGVAASPADAAQVVVAAAAVLRARSSYAFPRIPWGMLMMNSTSIRP